MKLWPQLALAAIAGLALARPALAQAPALNAHASDTAKSKVAAHRATQVRGSVVTPPTRPVTPATPAVPSKGATPGTGGTPAVPATPATPAVPPARPTTPLPPPRPDGPASPRQSGGHRP